MAEQNVTFSPAAATLVSAVYEEIASRTRESEIRQAMTYQHRDPELDTVPFMSVYRWSQEAGLKITPILGAEPEKEFRLWQIEKVRNVKVKDVRDPETGCWERHTSGVVIARLHYNPPIVQRLIVVRLDFYASNGNRYKHEVQVTGWNERGDDSELDDES
jgi:hypothetical protein